MQTVREEPTHPLWEVHRLALNLASTSTTKDTYLMSGRQSFSRGSACPFQASRKAGALWEKEGRPLQFQEEET